MEKRQRQLVDFNEIVKEIEENKILLPDFQREFVWSDKKAQSKLVASAMCKMPLGSILVLPSKAGEFAAKRIGSNNGYIELPDDAEVDFLLDGQQRITVLTNVFSNVIHQKVCKIRSLKRRFFLKIPKKGHYFYENNFFGLNNFNFPLANPKTDIPKFMTEEIDELIEIKEFNKKDDVPYNPYKEEIEESLLTSECLNEKNSYLIPLYLLTQTDDTTESNRMILEDIIAEISKIRVTEIIQEYEKAAHSEEKSAVVNYYIAETEICKKITNNQADLRKELEKRAKNWAYEFRYYLEGCIEKMDLYIMEAPNANRAKAIEVFENLNKGGVKLNTFDLVMARVAKVNKNFYKELADEIRKPGNYFMEAVPDCISGVCKNYISGQSGYSAGIDMDYCNENNEIHKAYKDVFLNVLSLVSNNPFMESDRKKNSCIGKDDILRLTANQINENYKKVCAGLDRSAFFLKTRCGLRGIGEVNYKLMLNIIGFIFTRDEWYKSCEVQNCLEAWYWGAIFSGHYDKDQNVIMLQDLEQLIDILNGKSGVQWLLALRDKTFHMQDFSDSSFLLYENYVNTKNAPKDILGNYICQFYLAQTYPDMFQRDKKITTFMEKAEKLEKHHIIPLGSVKTVKESSQKLRTEKNIYNSPLNFIYITSEANKMIASKSVQDYESEIQNSAAVALDFDGYEKIQKGEKGVREILRNRHRKLSGKVENRIDTLLEDFRER